MPVLIVVLIALSIASALLWRAWRPARRADFIRSAPLPKGLYDKLRQRRPELSLKDCQLVAQALRQFFLAYLKGGLQPVSMPSQVVDELWHEFILYTRDYERFCRQAFGRFMHHTPAVVLGSEQRSNAGLRRCWWQACRAENIHPRTPTRLPLLFAIDSKLNIADGFRYAPDCGPLRRDGKGDRGGDGGAVYCGGDFASASVDGSTDGFGGKHGGHGDDAGNGDGNGNGDAGGGDGGGCGGGCSS